MIKFNILLQVHNSQESNVAPFLALIGIFTSLGFKNIRKKRFLDDTVDGQNPAPVDIVDGSDILHNLGCKRQSKQCDKP